MSAQYLEEASKEKDLENTSVWDRDGETEVCSNGPGHIITLMTKVATIPKYGKKLKHILLRNQKADDLETWYAASGARVLPNFFK